MKTGAPPRPTQAAPAAIDGKMIASFAFSMLLVTAVLFVAAGRLDWLMGWLYVGVSLVLTAVSRILVVRKSPDLLEERAHSREHGNVKSWDRILMPLVAIAGPFLGLLVAGLDKRFGWSPALPPWLPFVALAAVSLGYALSIWALVANRFFSAVVRIQTERGHTVISTGPYAWVRHPGYAGGIVCNLAGPLVLGSLWALIPFGLVVLLTILRTSLEDRTLQAELAGYKEYAGRVRYRLLPGVW